MNLSLSQQTLLTLSDNKPEMLLAIKAGVFYVEATPCVNDSFCIGCFEGDDGESPALQATLTETKEDHQSMVDDWNTQIINKEREVGDVWLGLVLKALWDGGNTITLIDGDETVYQGEWRELTGL